MALLQIAEPKGKKRRSSPACLQGIDLGTTNVIAAVRSGEASTLVRSTRSKHLPSVVQYQSESYTTGDEARANAQTGP